MTLLDVMTQLHNCLHDLDEIGESIAAAHLSACIDALSDALPTDSISSDTD